MVKKFREFVFRSCRVWIFADYPLEGGGSARNSRFEFKLSNFRRVFALLKIEKWLKWTPFRKERCCVGSWKFPISPLCVVCFSFAPKRLAISFIIFCARPEICRKCVLWIVIRSRANFVSKYIRICIIYIIKSNQNRK